MTRLQHVLIVALLVAGSAVLWRFDPGLTLPHLSGIIAEGWRAPFRTAGALPVWVWWTAFGVAMSLRCKGRRGRPGCRPTACSR
jgi:hypothetical protein